MLFKGKLQALQFRCFTHNQRLGGGRRYVNHCATRAVGLEIGTSQVTLPVVADRFVITPLIVLSGAFLAFRAPDCNGWPRRWVPGGRRDWRPRRTCRIPT